MRHADQIGRVRMQNDFIVTAHCTQIIMHHQMRRQFGGRQNQLLGYDIITFTIPGDTDQGTVGKRVLCDIAHPLSGTGDIENMPGEGGHCFLQRNSRPQCGERFFDVAHQVGQVYGNVTAVTFRPSFCPEITGHFGDTADLGHQFFIVSDCFHFTYYIFFYEGHAPNLKPSS